MQKTITDLLLGQPAIIVMLVLGVLGSNILWYRYHLKLINFWVDIAKYLLDIIISFAKDSVGIKTDVLDKINEIKRKIDKWENER